MNLRLALFAAMASVALILTATAIAYDVLADLALAFFFSVLASTLPGILMRRSTAIITTLTIGGLCIVISLTIGTYFLGCDCVRGDGPDAAIIFIAVITGGIAVLEPDPKLS